NLLSFRFSFTSTNYAVRALSKVSLTVKFIVKTGIGEKAHLILVQNQSTFRLLGSIGTEVTVETNNPLNISVKEGLGIKGRNDGGHFLGSGSTPDSGSLSSGILEVKLSQKVESGVEIL
ncbi:hypothetical protein PpSQ1_26580, partial [Pseudomonas putida]